MIRARCILAIAWMGCIFFGLAPSVRAGDAKGEALYQKARKAYYELRGSPEKQKFRHNWQRAAHLFERVVERYPDSSRADDALFTAGRLYNDLYRVSRVKEDLNLSIKCFKQLIEKYPKSHLADDAQLYVALQWIEFRKKSDRAREALSDLVDRFPRGDVVPKARRMLEDLGGPEADDGVAEHAPPPAQEKPAEAAGKADAAAKAAAADKGSGPEPILSSIEHQAGPDYTRVTLVTRDSSQYKFGVLPASKKYKFPRIYVDLHDTRIDPNLKGPIPVRDSVVRRVRFGFHEPTVVRVVIELKTLGEYKVFPMDSPSRVVVDVSSSSDQVASIIGDKAREKPKPTPKPAATKPHLPTKADSKPGRSLSMLAGLKVRRVVIDPGHGGRDPGAIGKRRTLEKDITLDVARRLAALLRKDEELGLREVAMTRTDDRFVALETRTAIANKKGADLFISVHCNAHRQRRFKGVETFYLDLTNDRYSIKLAARENATSEKTISDLKFILADLALKSHVDDSIALGRSIQKATVGTLRRKYKGIRDLHLKPALFYVLIGARMPSVLVETSFISNPSEENRLRTKQYRQRLAEGIHTGIRNWIKARNEEFDPDS